MRKALCWGGLVLAVLSFSAGASVAQDTAPKRMKPALLVIDIQNAYLPFMADQDRERSMRLINAAIRLFRLRGYPVIRVYHTDPGYGPEPGSKEFEYPDSVLIKPDDPKIIKNYPSAFKKTELEKLLREKDRNTLFLCGLSSTGCVLATYQGAQDLDFDVFMVRHALLGPNAMHTAAVEDFCENVGYEALRVMLQNAEK